MISSALAAGLVVANGIIVVNGCVMASGHCPNAVQLSADSLWRAGLSCVGCAAAPKPGAEPYQVHRVLLDWGVLRTPTRGKPARHRSPLPAAGPVATAVYRSCNSFALWEIYVSAVGFKSSSHRRTCMNTLSEPPSRLSSRHAPSLFPLKHPVFRLIALSRSTDRALPCPAS